MTQNERRQNILNILKDTKVMETSKLCKKLFCSESTLRRDLLKLEEDNLIIRKYGKVALASTQYYEFSYFFRETENIQEKQYISQIAKDFLLEGQVLFLDSSSTLDSLCNYMSDKHFTVVTNCLKKAINLRSYQNVQVFLAGGTVKLNSTSVLGDFSRDFFSNFTADIAFISCSGIDPQGFYESDYLQGIVKRQMIKYAKKIILVADNSKVDMAGFFKTASFCDIDVLVTNAPLPIYYKEIDCQVLF